MGLVVCIDLVSPHGEARGSESRAIHPASSITHYIEEQPHVTKATGGDRASKITTTTNICTVSAWLVL